MRKLIRLCGAVDGTFGWICNDKKGHKGWHHMRSTIDSAIYAFSDRNDLKRVNWRVKK